ncbi:SGNH/GDSL hydrolase family protein [Pseudorhodoferax sp.]|uniref:SGNH/GDSL hydrolase family protein n=1 Tax=Pseudorhodoferax sp. TaxID=1993553 RepID=UPI002DD62502|nr:SGNH/GDSL hydrolase family protein [Pseudorhodoferax sp.]
MHAVIPGLAPTPSITIRSDFMPFKLRCLAALTTLLLSACGGGSDDRSDARLVSFGDSLSDVGSYRTAGIAALGGGKYTVNGAADGIWVEQLAVRLGLPAPCAAQTGLQASGVFAALAATVSNQPTCTAYAQGGSRVSDPVGPGNAALLASPDPATAATGQLGQLTVPVATQIANHLAAHGGRFAERDLVTVLAGSNDLFVQLGAVAAGAQTAQGAAQAVAQAATELVALVKTQVLANGATRVLVLNLPNIGNTPAMLAAQAAGSTGVRELADGLAQAFNATLAAGLAGNANVQLVDVYAENTRQAANPAAYGLSNVTTPACTNTFAGVASVTGSSLLCSVSTTRPDSARYLFADDVHPTPYGHSLLRDLVLPALARAGWN